MVRRTSLLLSTWLAACDDSVVPPQATSSDSSSSAETSAAGLTGGGGATSTGGGAAGAGGSVPSPGNAVLLEDGRVLPLYASGTAYEPSRAIALDHAGTAVRILSQEGALLDELEVGDGALFGGFDHDADGVVDVGLVRTEPTGMSCGASALNRTRIDLVSVRTGTIAPLAPSLDAICWTFPGTTYPTDQWSGLTPLFGAPGTMMFESPYYATAGRFLSFAGESFTEQASVFYPSTSSYDSTYAADKPNAYGNGASFTQYAHVANGLVVERSGEPHAAFFTSSRFVMYRPAAAPADRLVLDVPYLTGGRVDLVGRNYGLVVHEPSAPHLLSLIAGTDTRSMRDDMDTGTLASDVWGAIERHVSIIELDSGVVSDRFFSYAHDASDSHQYERRIVYPAHGAQPLFSGEAPRLIFNVYEAGKWRVVVTQPGSVDDDVTFPDRFVWDVADVDDDGELEWFISPTRDPSDPDVPGYYFTKWRTVVARLLPDKTMQDQQTIEGLLPHLVPKFREAARTSSYGSLYPVLFERRLDGGSGVLFRAGVGEPVVRVTLD